MRMKAVNNSTFIRDLVVSRRAPNISPNRPEGNCGRLAQ
jgi:hypothetical protein